MNCDRLFLRYPSLLDRINHERIEIKLHSRVGKGSRIKKAPKRKENEATKMNKEY